MSYPKLRDRVRLCSPVQTRQPSGAVKEGWSDPVTAYADVEYLGSRTYTAALAEQTGCPVRVIVRKRPVAEGWRALVDGAPFKVSTVEPHRERGFLVLMLKKDDGNG